MVTCPDVIPEPIFTLTEDVPAVPDPLAIFTDPDVTMPFLIFTFPVVVESLCIFTVPLLTVVVLFEFPTATKPEVVPDAMLTAVV